MRNRIVKQLLMCCMGISLVVGTPVVGWASETETTEEASGEVTEEELEDTGEAETIEVTQANKTPVIYEDDEIKVSVQSVKYDGNWGSPFYQINYSVENNSKEDLKVIMYNSSVDDFQVQSYTGTYLADATIKSGKNGIIDWSIWEKDFTTYGIEDFTAWESTIQLSYNNKSFFEKNIVINRDVFENSSEQNTTSGNAAISTDISDVNINSDDPVQEPIEVYNDDGVKITITKYEKTEYGSAKLTMNVVNLNHHNLRFTATDKVVVNGTTSNCSPYGEIQSGKTGDVVLELYPEQMGGLLVDDIKSIEFKIAIYITDNNRSNFKDESNEIFLSVNGDVVTQRVVYTDAEHIKQVQQLLVALGYNSGSADGVPGKLTNSAILQFQKDHGLSESTDITPELIAELEKASQQ